MYNIKWQQQHQGNGIKHVGRFCTKTVKTNSEKIYDMLYYLRYLHAITYIRCKHIYIVSEELWEYLRFLSVTVFCIYFTMFTGAWPIEPSNPLSLQQTQRIWIIMMASSNENIFPRYWPFVRRIQRLPEDSLPKGQCTGLWCFLWSALVQIVKQIIVTRVIWDAIALIMVSLWWHHRNTRTLIFLSQWNTAHQNNRLNSRYIPCNNMRAYPWYSARCCVVCLLGPSPLTWVLACNPSSTKPPPMPI